MVEEHGFTQMYLVDTVNNAPLVAAYAAKIIQSRQEEYEISIDCMYKVGVHINANLYLYIWMSWMSIFIASS